MSSRFRPRLDALEARDVPAAFSFRLPDGTVGSGQFSTPDGMDPSQPIQVLMVTDLTVTKGGVAYTVSPGATAQYSSGFLMGVTGTAVGPATIALNGPSAQVGGYTAMVTFDSSDTQASFTLPDGTVGALSYTIPWDQVDATQASQALAPTAFNLNIAGQNFTSGFASYTTAPTLLFANGEFQGVSFALDTSMAFGFAYSSVSMSGLNVTAVQAGTGQLLVAAAQKKQTMVDLNFTNTYATDAVNITVKVTFADGSTKEEIVLVPASSDATTLRNFIWSTLDDMAGIKADKTDGNHLTVKGTDKLLKSVEFTAGKDRLNRDPGIVYLKAKVLATADVTPVVKVNGTEVPK